MADAVTPGTAKAKLALSRAELVAAMGFAAVQSATEEDAVKVVELPRRESRSMASAVAATARESVLGRWWRRHPINSVFQLGEPLLAHYAQRHPGKLIAYGAGTGALLWILKPWKLLSVATVVTLLLKSSNVSGMISAVITKSSGAPRRGPTAVGPAAPAPWQGAAAPQPSSAKPSRPA